MYTTLIEPRRAGAPHLERPRTGRFSTAVSISPQPDWGARAYAAGHIPHALYAHLDRDLAGAAHTGTAAAIRCRSVAALAATLGRLGIDDGVQVVAYDQGNGAFAARLWWLLRWVGHRAVAVLNGGSPPGSRRACRSEYGAGRAPPRRFTRASRTTPCSPAPLEIAARGRRGRARARRAAAGRCARRRPLRGRERDHRPGRGTHSRRAQPPFAAQPRRAGTIPRPRQLRDALGGDACAASAPQQVIAMCGSGVTACHNLLALEVAGLRGCAAVCRLVERVDPRSGARGRARARRRRLSPCDHRSHECSAGAVDPAAACRVPLAGHTFLI